MSNKFSAGDSFPEIFLSTISDGKVALGKPLEGYDWRLVVIYRGEHCPLCTKYLDRLEELRQGLHDLKIDVIAVSGDSREQVENHSTRLSARFPIAYGLSVEQMNQLGLYISSPRSAEETDHPFAEPGLFVINEKGKVQLIDISNGPFARPELKVLISGLAFIRNPENNYPIRGTYQ